MPHTLLDIKALAHREAMPARRRTYREFAEAEIVMPEGPRRGFKYRASFMPFTALLMDEFARGRFRDFFGSGPAQGSKTLHFCVIPTLYHLFEIQEDVIFGAPTGVMAKAAFESRIRPAIESSQYRKYLPTKGGSSRGGVSDYIRFGNGALVRFLGAGGGDHQLSSYTARVVVATELDKMDEAGKVSDETDPVSKLKARTAAFGRFARFFGECTMSTKGGRIYREVVELGTDSRVHLPCPHCHHWIWPERKGLTGWQGAADEMAAREAVRFQCPNCSAMWTEKDRETALKDPRIVARGQEVNEAGQVTGDMPKTLTYGFRWNCMASPLKEMADVAAKEWKSERSGIATDEKELCQFEWVEPYEESWDEINRPDEKTILAKITDNPLWKRGVIPEGTLKLTLGVDVGKRIIWYVLMAWSAEGRGHVVDFKGIDVPNPETGGPLAILSCLRDFRDNVINPGWGGRAGDHPDGPAPGRRPDLTLVDSGWQSDPVYAFVRESGQGRYRASKGFGTNSRNGMWKTGQAAQAPTEVKRAGHEWREIVQQNGIALVAIHADHWRGLVHDGFWAAHGAPGSITIFHELKNDRQLGVFARQVVAEQRQIVEQPGKERKLVWVVLSKINHLGDCLVYARCAAEMLGIRLAPPPKQPARAPQQVQQQGIRKIRTRY